MARGLFRLWVMISVPWIVASSLLFFTEISTQLATMRAPYTGCVAPTGPDGPWRQYQTLCTEREELNQRTSHERVRVMARNDIIAFSALIVVPAMVLGFLFAGFVWVVNGFRRPART